jgi:single-strand DNA-binding protein
MANNNEVRLTGNLGKDAEFRPEVGSNGLATFSLAINRYRPTDNGYEKTKTDWFRCIAWGAVAQRVAQLKKGERVALVGRLESREWKDKKGVEHSSVEVVVESISRAESLKGNQSAPNAAEPAQEPVLAIDPDADELPLDAADATDKSAKPATPVATKAGNSTQPKPVKAPATVATPTPATRSRRTKTAA